MYLRFETVRALITLFTIGHTIIFKLNLSLKFSFTIELPVAIYPGHEKGTKEWMNVTDQM